MKREYEKKLYEERNTDLIQQLQRIIEKIKFEISEKKREQAYSLVLRYYSEIKKEKPEILIIGENHTDGYHSYMESLLVESCKPEYVLMEHLGSTREEYIEKLKALLHNEKEAENIVKILKREILEFFKFLLYPKMKMIKGKMREYEAIEYKAMLKIFEYSVEQELGMLLPILSSANKVGAKIAGCDIDTMDLMNFINLIDKTFTLFPRGDRRREEIMARRIIEYLNKINDKRKREMIRKNRVPVMVIVGEKHTERIAKKLRKSGIKTKVINLKPMEDEKIILARYALHHGACILLLKKFLEKSE